MRGNPVWSWLAEISKTALYKIKGNSSCCASQHSLEQPGTGAACGMSDVSHPEPSCWGSTPRVFRVNHTYPCKSQGPRSKVTTGTAQGRARDGSGGSSSSSKGCQHILQAGPFPGAQQQPGETEVSKSSAGKRMFR